jgi:hypothetical protein
MASAIERYEKHALTMTQAKIYGAIIKREQVEGPQKLSTDINWETVEGNENNRFSN